MVHVFITAIHLQLLTRIYVVPVYDGRKGINMRQLQSIHRSLKPWTRDLSGCICLVGYTANTWIGKAAVKQLSLNVQWVVVLASCDAWLIYSQRTRLPKLILYTLFVCAWTISYTINWSWSIFWTLIIKQVFVSLERGMDCWKLSTDCKHATALFYNAATTSLSSFLWSFEWVFGLSYCSHSFWVIHTIKCVYSLIQQTVLNALPA